MHFEYFRYKRYMENIEYLNLLTEDARRTIWRVEYCPKSSDNAPSAAQTGEHPLGLKPGTYTLMRLNAADDSALAEALCSLDPNPGLATLLAVQHLTGTAEAAQKTESAGTLQWYEPLEAGTLSALLAAREHIPVAEVASLARSLCEGLAHLHHQGFIHGAISTENVLISTHGTPKLIDTRHAPGNLSTSALSLAQAEDTRALARLLWHALTGKPPAAAHERIPLPLAAEDITENMGYTLENVLDTDLPSLETIVEVFSKVQAVPLNAYLSAPEDVRERMPAASNQQQGSKSKPVQNAPAAKARPKEPKARQESSNKPQKKILQTSKNRMLLGALALTLAVGVGVVSYQLGSHDSAPVQTASATTAANEHDDERKIIETLIEERNRELTEKGAPTLQVRSLTKVEHKGDTLALTAEVQAPGYTPTEAELRDKGVRMQDGMAVQKVTFELHQDNGHWRIASAVPVSE